MLKWPGYVEMRMENSQIYILKDSKIKQELDCKMVETVVQIKWVGYIEMTLINSRLINFQSKAIYQRCNLINTVIKLYIFTCYTGYHYI